MSRNKDRLGIPDTTPDNSGPPPQVRLLRIVAFLLSFQRSLLKFRQQADTTQKITRFTIKKRLRSSR